MIQVKQSKKHGQFYFNVLSGNHKIVATSEMYVRKRNALRAAKMIKDLFQKKIVVIRDMTI